MPYLEALGTFRGQVREAARAAAAPAVLALCDALRDDVLPALGVRLEDKPGTTRTWMDGRMYTSTCQCIARMRAHTHTNIHTHIRNWNIYNQNIKSSNLD